LASCGRNFATGSLRMSLPSSISIMAATDAKGLVMEYRRKMASLPIGAPVAGSRTPKLSK
jgi:hypothetical protein